MTSIRSHMRLRKLVVVVSGAIVALLMCQQTAMAQPGSWFNYTNEVGDNLPYTNTTVLDPDGLNNIPGDGDDGTYVTTLLNWRWGRPSGTGQPAEVGAYGNPIGRDTTPALALANAKTALQIRMFVSGAGSGFSAAQGNVYTNMTVDSSVGTFVLNNAQLDGGATLTVSGTGIVSAPLGFSANGLGLNPVRDMPTAQGGDGWGSTVRYFRPPGPATTTAYGAATATSNNKSWFGNSLDTTLHIHSGGTLTNAGSTNTCVDSGIGPIGHLGYDLDSKTGAITATVAGDYRMGSFSGSGSGGGFLTLRGYDAGTVLTMGSLTITPVREQIGLRPYSDSSAGMTGNYGLYGISTGGATDATNIPGGGSGVPAEAYPFNNKTTLALGGAVAGDGPYNVTASTSTTVPPDPFFSTGYSSAANGTSNYLVTAFAGAPGTELTFNSRAAELRVELTGQNTGGLFNTIAVSGALTMDPLAANANYNTLADFVLTLSGYTPVAGDLFSLVTAGSFVNTGSFQQLWDTDFSQDGATWQLHNINAGVPGIYLEVMDVEGGEVVPEPSTFGLAAIGLLGLGWAARRRMRAATK